MDSEKKICGHQCSKLRGSDCGNCKNEAITAKYFQEKLIEANKRIEELETQIILSNDLGFLNENTFNEMQNKIQEL